MALSVYQEYTLSSFFFVSLSRTYIFFPPRECLSQCVLSPMRNWIVQEGRSAMRTGFITLFSTLKIIF